MFGDIDKMFMSQYYLLVSCGTGGFASSPNFRGIARPLDDENVNNAGQHDIKFEASSIHTGIFGGASKNWVMPSEYYRTDTNSKIFTVETNSSVKLTLGPK